MKKNLIFFFLFFVFYSTVYSQIRPIEKRDSSYIYSKIESFSNNRKITKLIYSLIFRPVIPVVVIGKKRERVKKGSSVPFEGKVIRNIYIETFDPFGYDSGDSTITPSGFVPKAGNALHVKTIPAKIRNILMVKRHDTYDSLRIKESERLIRSQSYVREVTILPVLTKGDSVDLYIKVYDVWSIIAVGSATPSNFVIDIRDKNFVGLGHEFRGDYKYDYKLGKSAYKGDYYIPNISNTFINSDLHYRFDENKNYFESISLNRPFYSALTSWAGGVSFYQNLNRQILYGKDSSSFLQTYKSNYQDYWIGRSWQLFKGKTEDKRTTTIISSARYYRLHYVKRAPEEYDSSGIYANEDFYLLRVGFSRRSYKKDNYIFRYGSTEDVPTGRSYSFIGGYQIKEGLERIYLGSKIYMANYHNWGYFNWYLEYGTFLRSGKFEEGTLITGINYFSGLIRIGRWKFRQFIKPQCTLGFSRPASDNLNLNNDSGIRGFNSTILKGTQKLIFTFQLQSYAPWNLIGFRIGPYLVCSFGMLGTENELFRKSPVYSSFGIGLLIKNDYLLMSSFQISVAYYPVIPGIGDRIIKMNPVKASDFGYRGFDVDQPSPVIYK